MSKKFIIANWKMKPESPAQVREILSRTNDVLGEIGEERELSLVFCPPFVFLDEVQSSIGQSHLLHEAELGAQDIATRDDVAMTGEVSGTQLVQSGVRYVIVGHSERRYQLNEDDQTVNQKLKMALEHELVPIVCVGEQVRGDGWEEVLREQVRATCEGLDAATIQRCIFAYEPVWAISTNPGARPDTPDSATQSIQLLREQLASEYGADGVTFLYGGSVNPDNATQFLQADGVGGVLIGGASVRPDDFAAILRQAATLP